MANELTELKVQTRCTNSLAVMPVMDIAVAIDRRNQMVKFVQTIMAKDTDFGVIPGTDKPTLLKPGAEKLTTFFGLTKRFGIIEKVEDWTGKDHNGEPFFYYLYRCGLYRGDVLIAESDGSCNSFEAKYRYRKSERVCPDCGQASIIKGKAQYGGGWLCWNKKGGCGAKFNDGDIAIESQQVGRIPNPDVTDQVNTLQKMAQKRALIAATLLAVNASEFFTQDMEDLIEEPFVVTKPSTAISQVAIDGKVFSTFDDLLYGLYEKFGWEKQEAIDKLHLAGFHSVPKETNGELKTRLSEMYKTVIEKEAAGLLSKA